MAVLFVPGDFPSINAAVNTVAPGDTILVQNGIYEEAVVIPTAKSAIRIIADDAPGQVILDGGGRRSIGFNLMANNVEIKGFTIINFLTSGIQVSGPTGLLFLIGSKLMENIIMNISQGDGITLIDSFATLIWRNRITGARRQGISITGSTMNTWTLENELDGNGDNGVTNQTNANVGGTITHNRILANSGDGILDNAGANLIFANFIAGSGKNGIETAAPMSTAGFEGIVANHIAGNQQDGVRLEQDRNVVAGNRLQNNLGAGVRIDTEFNLVQSNEITRNRDNGIIITQSAQKNLIIRNSLANNIPVDIQNDNPQNDFVENHCQTSRPSGLCSPICSGGSMETAPQPESEGRGL